MLTVAITLLAAGTSMQVPDSQFSVSDWGGLALFKGRDKILKTGFMFDLSRSYSRIVCEEENKDIESAEIAGVKVKLTPATASMFRQLKDGTIIIGADDAKKMVIQIDWVTGRAIIAPAGTTSLPKTLLNARRIKFTRENTMWFAPGKVPLFGLHRFSGITNVPDDDLIQSLRNVAFYKGIGRDIRIADNFNQDRQGLAIGLRRYTTVDLANNQLFSYNLDASDESATLMNIVLACPVSVQGREVWVQVDKPTKDLPAGKHKIARFDGMTTKSILEELDLPNRERLWFIIETLSEVKTLRSNLPTERGKNSDSFRTPSEVTRLAPSPINWERGRVLGSSCRGALPGLVRQV